MQTPMHWDLHWDFVVAFLLPPQDMIVETPEKLMRPSVTAAESTLKWFKDSRRPSPSSLLLSCFLLLLLLLLVPHPPPPPPPPHPISRSLSIYKQSTSKSLLVCSLILHVIVARPSYIALAVAPGIPPLPPPRVTSPLACLRPAFGVNFIGAAVVTLSLISPSRVILSQTPQA